MSLVFIQASNLQIATWNFINAVTHSGLDIFDVTKAFKQVPLTDDSSTYSEDTTTTDGDSISSDSSKDSGIYGQDIDTDPDLLSYHVMLDQSMVTSG